jgi:hypothetical protein
LRREEGQATTTATADALAEMTERKANATADSLRDGRKKGNVGDNIVGRGAS